MKPSARARQQRSEAKRDRRRRRKAAAPAPRKSRCPRCKYATPDLDAGGFIRCATCGSVKR